MSGVAATSFPPASIAPFTGDHHQWTVDRRGRNFTVRVIEPAAYSPEHHGELFNAVLSALISGSPSKVDPLDEAPLAGPPEPFDLVTFPEAFVTKDDLLAALRDFSSMGPSGCFHVGLRPSAADQQHLFDKAQILDLIQRLAALPDAVAADFNGFSGWAKAQNSKHLFNIGCLFTLDNNHRLRICLHPKIVRSRFETHPLPEHLMHEANHIALVTLYPADKRYLSVTLQPIICSDALNLPTERNTGSPLVAVNRYAHCLGDSPPDHVDVVSVATCTPQTPETLYSGADYRSWHQQFQDSFRSAANDSNYARHHKAAFVLSNFLNLQGGGKGGLSGVFLPVPTHIGRFPSEVIASGWGRPKTQAESGVEPGPNRWSSPNDVGQLARWQTRGFIAALSPFLYADAEVRIFGFSIQRLPRDNPAWDSPAALVDLQLQVSRRTGAGLHFERQELRHAV